MECTEELIARARRGDRQAQEALIEAFGQRLTSAMRRRVASHGKGHLDQEDLVQETFLQAFSSLDRFSWGGEDSFYPWLYGIAKNVLRRASEQSARTRQLEIPERVRARETAPSKAARRGERFDRLEECLRTLKPEYREVLRLARLEGMKVKEIARELNRSEYAVKHLIARAVRELRDSFGDTESLHLPPRSLDLPGADHAPE